MKKLVLATVVITAFVFSACEKAADPEIITVSTEHKCFEIDFTANWCPPCGSAKPIVKEVQGRYPYKLVSMELHASNDSFYNATMYWHWANIYNVTGIPSMIGGNRRISWGYVAPTFELDTSDFYHIIDSTINTPAPCGIGIAKSISGSTMTIKTKTVFFEPNQGEFTLAVYIVEDRLYFEQANSEDWYHDDVFRASVTDPQGRGTTLINGSVAKGDTYDNEFTYTIPSNFVQANLHVIAVVYKMGADPKPLAILNVNKI